MEGDCHEGENSLEHAAGRFKEIALWLNAGSENFCYWNMILSEKSESGWGWKQNSLVRVDRQSGEVFYNNDFAPVVLMSRFIRPGDQLLQTDVDGEGAAVAVRNKNGLTVFLQNQSNALSTQQIHVAGLSVAVELPATSICAFVFQ